MNGDVESDYAESKKPRLAAKEKCSDVLICTLHDSEFIESIFRREFRFDLKHLRATRK